MALVVSPFGAFLPAGAMPGRSSAARAQPRRGDSEGSCVAEIRLDGETFRVRSTECATLTCFAPGRFYHRGATLSGSRNTGDSHLCCLTRENHGCPSDVTAAT